MAAYAAGDLAGAKRPSSKRFQAHAKRTSAYSSASSRSDSRRQCLELVSPGVDDQADYERPSSPIRSSSPTREHSEGGDVPERQEWPLPIRRGHGGARRDQVDATRYGLGAASAQEALKKIPTTAGHDDIAPITIEIAFSIWLFTRCRRFSTGLLGQPPRDKDNADAHFLRGLTQGRGRRAAAINDFKRR